MNQDLEYIIDCYLDAVEDVAVLKDQVMRCVLNSSYGKEIQNKILKLLDKEIDKLY